MQESERLGKDSGVTCTHTLKKEKTIRRVEETTDLLWNKYGNLCFSFHFCGVYEEAIFLFFLEPWPCKVKMSKQQPHKWRGRLRCDQNFILVVVIKLCATALLRKPGHVIKKDKASQFCMIFYIGAQEQEKGTHCHGQRPGLELRFLGCCKYTRRLAKDRDKNI